MVRNTSTIETGGAETRQLVAVVRVKELVWLALGVIDLILALDFIFKLANANLTGFVSFIANLANFFAAPFRDIFSVQPQTTGFFDWADLVAVVVYLLIAWIVIRLVSILLTPKSYSTHTEI